MGVRVAGVVGDGGVGERDFWRIITKYHENSDKNITGGGVVLKIYQISVTYVDDSLLILMGFFQMITVLVLVHKPLQPPPPQLLHFHHFHHVSIYLEI